MSRANSPAFPRAATHAHPETAGMSLREWYAGMALQGMLADPTGDSPNERYSDIQARYVRVAVGYADALLAELAKEPQ